MAANVKVVSVSLPISALDRLDKLAARDGLSRSKKVAALIEGEGRGAPDVRVDGRRFVPARGKR